MVVPCEAQSVAVVPLDAVSDHGLQPLKGRSFLVRFFAGFWSNFLEQYKIWVLGFFALTTLISVIGIVTNLQVDGSPPVIFPPSHNQILGAEIFDRFEKAVSIAQSPILEEVYMCDPGATPVRSKKDTVLGCATYAAVGYCSNPHFEGTMLAACSTSCGFTAHCLATWCPVDEAPNVTRTEIGRCDCYQENDAEVDSSTAASPGIIRYETSVIGFDKESWMNLEPHLRNMYMEMTGTIGNGWTQQFSYRQTIEEGEDSWERNPAIPEAQNLATYVQQHWRSGSLATWTSFEAPVFSVLTLPNNSQSSASFSASVVRQKCFCDGIAPCTGWSSHRRTVYHPLTGPGGATWESSVDVLEEASQTRRLKPLDEEWPTHRLTPSDKESAVSGEVLARMNQVMTGLVAPRRLQTEQASTPVSIVWGMKVKQLGPFDLFVETETEQVWLPDETFDPADPWAQRAMMRATENLPEALKVLDGSTWLQAFEAWLIREGLEFPARSFHSSSRQFFADRAGSRYATHVLRDDVGKVVIVKVEFDIGVSFGSGLEETTATRKAWDDWVSTRNAMASLKANKALQVSSLWVNVEAQDGILRSTATTISTAILIGYVAAVIFTQDFLLSLFPMLSVMLTVLCLLFTMVGILQWPFGAVDVIALIVFLGYMFTFNLHMAQYYNHAKLPMELLKQVEAELPPAVTRERLFRERFCRVNHALTSIGQSLLCSAGTTTMSAICLLLCTLQFFVKFGAVILSVTLLSILHSLMFLPSLLLLCGPTSKSCSNFGRLLASRRQSAVSEAEIPSKDDEDAPSGGIAPPSEKMTTPPPPLPPVPPPEEPAEIIGSEEVDLSPTGPQTDRSPQTVRHVGIRDVPSRDEEV